MVTIKIADVLTLLRLINRARWQRDWQATEEEKISFGRVCQALMDTGIDGNDLRQMIWGDNGEGGK